MKSFALFAVAAIGICSSHNAFAQAISGDAVGTVQDVSGAAIANVTVTSTNQETNTRSTAVT